MTVFIALTEAELDDLYERSKLDDSIIVGSEVRQLIAEIWRHRKSTTQAELQLWFDVRTAADQMALAKWSAAHPATSTPQIPEHADLVIWLLDLLLATSNASARLIEEMNHFERTDAGVIDWKMEADRANRLLAQRDHYIETLEAVLRRASKWVRQNPEANAGDHAGEELLCIVRDVATLTPEQMNDRTTIAARLDRVDTALAKRVGTMIEQNSALKNYLTEWLRCYALDIFPEPDLAKAAEIMKANGMTIDSLSANMGRHILSRVIERLDNPETD